ncbi:hypothetical protein Tco_0821733 [Tanacetum coccineum]|uniref:Reverse transcriptase domain-containing protein n=1 Tax=Tanacetum coccineum TaxID=301880 RepID=A0ABQ5AHW2_9ASTR
MGTFRPVVLRYDMYGIVDPNMQNEFGISSWRGSRVDGRSYLLSGAIDGSEANRIIRDSKLEFENSRFTFDLVPLSYESVDVVVGENWLLRHKAERDLVGFTPRRRIGFHMKLVKGAMPICEGSCRLTFLERKEVWNDCRSCKVRVGSNGNLLWEASILYHEKKDTLKFTTMPFGLTNAPAIFMELMSRMIVESLKEEKMYMKFSNNVEAEHRGSYLDVEGIKWVLKKDCMTNVMLYRGVGRRSEAKNEFEIDVRRSDLVLMPQVVKSRDEIFSRWGYCDNHDLSSFDVVVGMDWLSKRKFVIVFHEKVVRIPSEGDEILRVHGEQEEHGVHLKLVLELLRKEKLYAKFTKSEIVRNWEVPTTPSESSVKDKILATLSETSKVENVPAKMLRDLNQQMENRADDGESCDVKDFLACCNSLRYLSENEIESSWILSLNFQGQSSEYDKANIVTDALSRKERVKPRRVRAMSMTIQYRLRGMILAAQRIYIDEIISSNEILVMINSD